MYICNCNGLNEKQVESAIKNGANSWLEVYTYHDCAPKCGKCIPEICQRMDKGNKAASTFFGAAMLAKA